MTNDSQLLLHGGKVFTAAASAPWADALVVQGERIVAVGPFEDLAARFPDARGRDVKGRTVLPGLIDAHNHFLATGESLSAVNLRYPAVSSVDEIVRLLSAAADQTVPGEPVTGAGYDDAKYPTALTRWELDRATSEHPVMVHHVSGHHVFVNSLALALSGVTDDTPDPQGGRLVRGADGRLTGQCLDAAMNLILPVAVDIKF